MSRFLKSLAFLIPVSAVATGAPLDGGSTNLNSERTCFQTGSPFSGVGDIGADVAIVYGIHNLPKRIHGWRAHDYHVQMMTGSAWGGYQDYLYGKYDRSNHVDEVQTDIHGTLDSHGGNVYYMCPSTNFGNYLCRGIQRALDAHVDAIYLEEPEFWVKNGYSEGFKREWRNYYGQDWRSPESSVDAAWKASKLKYFLYRRLLQQVFDHVQDFNKRTGQHVQCYVPTHSLLNYAHWQIVSPESSLARLNGCDGYIAQVWTGTARTPNMYHGVLKERTFETAFLEYGVMQNLVRSTGRSVWYLNDPVEDNPNHDWPDYRRNWESTLTASLFQPEVSRYEVAPWPERVFGGKYPKKAKPADRKSIPPEYATELQVVFNSLKNMKQDDVQWDCGTTGVGVLVSDSLMFERGNPAPSDPNMSHIYGMAMPLLMRGMPVTPVQLENVAIPHYLDPFHILFLTYDGMKPLSPEPHTALADWVKSGGVLVICDDDADPYNKVRDWWNSDGMRYGTPRQDLFERLGIEQRQMIQSGYGYALARVGKGAVVWWHKNPANMGDEQLVVIAKKAASLAKTDWLEKNYLMLRRGPYVIAAGLDDSIGGPARVLEGHFVNLFDSTLALQDKITISPGSRYYLLDLDRTNCATSCALASACRVIVLKEDEKNFSAYVEGVSNSPAIILMKTGKPPKSVHLGYKRLKDFNYSADDQLLRVRFTNESRQRKLTITF
ncbi:MAG TPA: hypothetical protein VH280_22875 [Verrucomicrobiae bacterium]|nr:hypothetical protein [Verrucomicrobiae bacterium]